MGCTELSVVKEKLNLSEFYIDPLEVEARNIIKYFNKEEVI
jgi:aspartate/glutamate racemase